MDGSKLIPVLGLVILATPAWAGEINAPGVPNFHQVNEHVYRGGQPADAGWASLANLGVKTVIDLRPAAEHSISQEEQAVVAAGMRYINRPMSGVSTPANEQIFEILTLLNSSGDGPVFVHCRRGADRVGTVIACYRIAHDRWPNEKALREAKSYGMSWIELGMKHYIQNFHMESLTGGLSPVADSR
jgi:tyrosine-protein phosphatase SIW14